jgi:hypothetical protein
LGPGRFPDALPFSVQGAEWPHFLRRLKVDNNTMISFAAVDFSVKDAGVLLLELEMIHNRRRI